VPPNAGRLDTVGRWIARRGLAFLALDLVRREHARLSVRCQLQRSSGSARSRSPRSMTSQYCVESINCTNVRYSFDARRGVRPSRARRASRGAGGCCPQGVRITPRAALISRRGRLSGIVGITSRMSARPERRSLGPRARLHARVGVASRASLTTQAVSWRGKRQIDGLS
jgi:hypothetical protein